MHHAKDFLGVGVGGGQDNCMAKFLASERDCSFTSILLLECDYLFWICHHHVHI